jgi:predicted metal-dependent hydrolase
VSEVAGERRAQKITVRHMAFDFPDDIDPVFVPGEPEESYGFIGLSLLLPYLEPYLIRTMKVARKQISDPQLIDDLERFSAQEGQHFREHIRFNAVIRKQGVPGLAQLEERLEADYQRFSRTRSLRFNLAYAEGFEALTTASARFAFEEADVRAMHPAVANLMLWHAVEELEHRTVAFDVYQHLCDSYFYRVCMGLFAQWHMARFIRRAARLMLEADPEVLAKHGGRAGHRRRRRMQARMALRRLLPDVLRTHLPWYTPHDIEFTPQMQQVAERYTEMAKSAA